MKRILVLLTLLAVAVIPAMAQSASSNDEVTALRSALEQALRENISLRADLEAARSEIDRLRGGAERPLAYTAMSAPNPGRTHIVREGETLGIIASRYYGTVNAYNRIFEANRNQISNVNLIYPGQQLFIP